MHTHPKISCLTSNLQTPKVNDPMRCLTVPLIKSRFFTWEPAHRACNLAVRGPWILVKSTPRSPIEMINAGTFLTECQTLPF